MAISTLQQALGGINSQVSESVAKVCNVFLDKMVFLSQSLHQPIFIMGMSGLLGQPWWNSWNMTSVTSKGCWSSRSCLFFDLCEILLTITWFIKISSESFWITYNYNSITIVFHHRHTCCSLKIILVQSDFKLPLFAFFLFPTLLKVKQYTDQTSVQSYWQYLKFTLDYSSYKGLCSYTFCTCYVPTMLFSEVSLLLPRQKKSWCH